MPSSFPSCLLHKFTINSKGWHRGESAQLPSMGPWFKSWRQCHMWVEFVVGSLPCSLLSTLRGFSPGTLVFRSPQKPIFPSSNSARNQGDEEPLCGCATDVPLNHFFKFYILSAIFDEYPTFFMWESFPGYMYVCP